MFVYVARWKGEVLCVVDVSLPQRAASYGTRACVYHQRRNSQVKVHLHRAIANTNAKVMPFLSCQMGSKPISYHTKQHR